MKAQEQAIAKLKKPREQLYADAIKTITQARDATQLLMREGIISQAPEEEIS